MENKLKIKFPDKEDDLLINLPFCEIPLNASSVIYAIDKFNNIKDMLFGVDEFVNYEGETALCFEWMLRYLLVENLKIIDNILQKTLRSISDTDAHEDYFDSFIGKPYTSYASDVLFMLRRLREIQRDIRMEQENIIDKIKEVRLSERVSRFKTLCISQSETTEK